LGVSSDGDGTECRKPSLLGKGTLLVSCPRNRQLMLAETMACREAGPWSGGLEVVPPSYVNVRAQSSLIREGPLLPPVVRRYLIGNEVIEKPRSVTAKNFPGELSEAFEGAIVREPRARQVNCVNGGRFIPGRLNGPERRVGLCGDATRAPTQGPGFRKREPARLPVQESWRKSAKSRGLGQSPIPEMFLFRML
jgi:hypothetical protein